MASAPHFQAKRASPLPRLVRDRQRSRLKLLSADSSRRGFAAALQPVAAPVNARAAAATSPSRSALSLAPALRIAARTSVGALLGVPASKGGSGAYSSASWILCA